MDHSIEDLNSAGIRQWKDIKADYPEIDLLSGNGFSISFSNKFFYKSIYENFKPNCDAQLINLFEKYETTNFEYILEILRHTATVNREYGLDNSLIKAAADSLKNGLITSINQVHPRKDEMDWGKIVNASHELVDNFNDIYTTNYDLLLYHIIMASCDAYRDDDDVKERLQDYFWGSGSVDYKQFMDYQSYPDYKHVYYLHGSLCLFQIGLSTYKLIKGGRGAELIELISDQIGKYKFPVFVSEGTSYDKERSVARNPYLRFCFDKLQASKRPLFIYGLSLASNDNHIIKRIATNPRKLVISIYSEGKTIAEITAEKMNHIVKFGARYKPSIEFVDSRSVFS